MSWDEDYHLRELRSATGANWIKEGPPTVARALRYHQQAKRRLVAMRVVLTVLMFVAIWSAIGAVVMGILVEVPYWNLLWITLITAPGWFFLYFFILDEFEDNEAIAEDNYQKVLNKTVEES